MSTALLFAGQGAEEPGMGLDGGPEARDLLALAGELAGVDAFRVLRRGGPDLDRTEVLQPLLVAVSLGALGEVDASFAAGHSLGELCAWVAAGVLTPEDAVRLAAVRGAAMAACAAARPGGLVALDGPLDALPDGVSLALHNAPGQWVYGGPEEALAGLGGRRLRVAGPWHTPAMAGAVGPLRAALADVPRGPCGLTVMRQDEAVPVGPEALDDALCAQLVRPVRWAETLEALGSAGVRDFVCVGVTRTMRGLVRATLPGARVRR
ncbi:MAG: ACP S-malonyltransferase [Alphaproteobacteria bacterium]|nr:ACP S-malonyltransferase [Alphaproteobacteria bacterium]